MKRDVYKITALCLSIIGFIFLMIGLTFYIIYRTGNYIETEAVIVDIKYDSSNEGSSTIVRFKDQNNDVYVIKVNYYSSTFDIDDKITIAYNPLKPTQVRIKDMFVVFPLIFSIIGLVIFISGMVLIIISIVNKNNEKSCKEYGKKKIAKVKEIKTIYYYQVNNKHPYIIICSARIDGVDQSFKSKFIFDFPPEYRENQIVNLYYISKKKYFIDVESLRDNDYDSEFMNF